MIAVPHPSDEGSAAILGRKGHAARRVRLEGRLHQAGPRPGLQGGAAVGTVEEVLAGLQSVERDQLVDAISHWLGQRAARRAECGRGLVRSTLQVDLVRASTRRFEAAAQLQLAGYMVYAAQYRTLGVTVTVSVCVLCGLRCVSMQHVTSHDTPQPTNPNREQIRISNQTQRGTKSEKLRRRRWRR